MRKLNFRYALLTEVLRISVRKTTPIADITFYLRCVCGCDGGGIFVSLAYTCYIDAIYGPRPEKTCLRGFATKLDSNQSSQLQRLNWF